MQPEVQSCCSSTLDVQRNHERGSAFVITLLSMVVLGIILLSLSVITQTERQIAANELTANRVLYASDSGLNLGVAKLLTSRRSTDTITPLTPTPVTYYLEDATVAGTKRGQQITVSPFVPLRMFYCELCAADLKDSQYFTVNHAVSSTARRLFWTGATATPGATATAQASKQTYFQVGIEPWEQPPLDAINPNNDFSLISQDTKGVYTP
ncbi:MAG: hypothetical protein K8J08_04365 [Thermoanaerobaculia bacterium]|nr:hypothetical protein [Thermoanaerobaculia bacterium]